MKRFFIGAILLITGCSSGPEVPKPAIAGKFPNACLVESVQMVQGLKQHNITAKVVAYTYGIPGDRLKGHAITAYLYPPGANQLWGWDSWHGSTRIRAYYRDNEGIAKRWHMMSQGSGQVIEASEL